MQKVSQILKVFTFIKLIIEFIQTIKFEKKKFRVCTLDRNSGKI